MPESLHDRIKRERSEALPAAAAVQEFRAYAEGDQGATLTTAQQHILRGVTRHAVADNVCRVILLTIASRIELLGFACDAAPVSDFLAVLVTKNALADLSADVHLAVPRDGDHYVMLRWQPAPPNRPPSEGRVTLHREPAWDGVTGTWLAYGDDGQPAYAVKDFQVWMGDPPVKMLRRTVYFPNHIERYLQTGDGWSPYPDAGTFSQPWLKRDKSPLHLPVIHFANATSGDEGPYGLSDLAGGVLGLQDELNDIQRDITAAARLTAYQMYAKTGAPISEEGSFPIGPGYVVEMEDAAADFKAIPAGSIASLLDAHGKKLQTIALVTSTPLHVITGDWPSGTALVRSEMPLVTKAKRLATSWGPAWATVAHRATEVYNTFGAPVLDENTLITTQFADPAQLDELTQIEVEKERVALIGQKEGLRTAWGLGEAKVPEDAAKAIIAANEAALVGQF